MVFFKKHTRPPLTDLHVKKELSQIHRRFQKYRHHLRDAWNKKQDPSNESLLLHKIFMTEYLINYLGCALLPEQAAYPLNGEAGTALRRAIHEDSKCMLY